jgi:hypothetical protein
LGSLAALLLLVPICSVGPGLLLTRGLRLNAGERLCAAIGLSLLLLYVSVLAIYTLALPRAAHLVVTVLCVVLDIAAWRDLRALARARSVRRMLLGYGALVAWTLLLLALVRCSSGGSSAGDYVEHYDRARFFLEHQPLDVRFLGVYPLPARPPLMNGVSAHFLAHVGATFDHHQLVFLLLNVACCMPVLMIAPALGRRPRGRWAASFVALAACSFAFVWNQTFSWTKPLTAFYVVLGLALYLAAIRKGDGRRFIGAFAAMSAGVLVHYSAGPYVLFLALHYLFFVWPGRPRRWREALGVAAVCAAILATWLAWSAAFFGLATTFGSNTALTPSAAYSGSTLAKIALNVRDTFVPHPLSGVSLARFAQASRLGSLRDYVFVIYTGCLSAGIGSVGGLVAIGLLFRSWRTGTRDRERLFWMLAVPFTTFVGIAVVAERCEFGTAAICLQPLVYLGLALLAVELARLPALVRWLLVAGAAVDLSFVLLQFRCQSLVYQVIFLPGGGVEVRGDEALSSQATLNWIGKEHAHLVFLGDRFEPAQRLLWTMAVAGAVAVVTWLALEAARARERAWP